MDDYIGMIKIFAGNFAPRGWAFCNGATLQIRQYTALYAILGTNYGGDGQTTFKLPNLAGTTVVGAGVSARSGNNYQIGRNGGSENGALTLSNMPPHIHPISGSVGLLVNPDSSDGTDPAGAFFGPSSDAHYSASPSTDMGALKVGLAVGVSGNGMPFDKRMPFIAVNYIICMEGNFPPRN